MYKRKESQRKFLSKTSHARDFNQAKSMIALLVNILNSTLKMNIEAKGISFYILSIKYHLEYKDTERIKHAI